MSSKTGYLFFFLYLLSVSLNAQIGFNEDFADSNFTVSPTWIGETSKFQVNAAKNLQLNDASTSGTAYLITTSTAILKASWQFYVKLDFNPSGSNYAKVYLSSNQEDLTQALNGYFVRIGGQSGTVDDVSLYRQDGSSEVELIDGIDGTVGLSPELLIKVTRDSSFTWELSIDTSSNFNNFTSQGSAIDTSYISSNFFGVSCIFTSTRSDKIFFDDFVVTGSIFQDTSSPKPFNLIVVDSQTIQLSFSELLDDSTAKNPSNFVVNKGIGNPNTINYVGLDSTLLQLSFSNSFQNGESYTLILNGIEDRNGNAQHNDTLSLFYFVPVPASYRDLQINEFYPDFSPSNGLPEAEYIEIYNASTKIFDLDNWSISDGVTTGALSSQFIRPGEYLVLCSNSDTIDFMPFGPFQGLTSFPSLNNNGDVLQLKDPNDQLIDEVKYDLNWYRNKNKEGGGWSLEQINPKSNCLGTTNFTASEAPIGGTPAQVNSVFDLTPDQTPPELLGATLISADSIQLLFTESMDSNSIQVAQYQFSSGNQIDTAYHLDSDVKQIMLVLDSPLDSGIQISISVQNISDCAGNQIGSINTSQLILPRVAEAFDVVINEILFNPNSGGYDFVELYNRSDKILSLQNWTLSNADGLLGTKTISDSTRLLYPGEYLGLSEDIQNISTNYPATRVNSFIEMTDLPSFNDDEGRVMLFNSKTQLLDQLDYNEDMHFELLVNNEGVSLERINPDNPSDPSNFHSAAENVGFATPAYENSQFFKQNNFHGEINIEPEIFSPDNDGYQDVLHINYQFESPGYVANVSIYDRNGRLIKSLVRNELLGNSGNFSWDGITNENQKARIGIYVILFEAFNSAGEKEVFKETAVVAGHLD